MTDFYTIRVRHRVGPELLHLLADLGPEVVEDCTIFRTPGADQPMLHGTLNRLANLGLEIIEVNRMETDP